MSLALHSLTLSEEFAGLDMAGRFDLIRREYGGKVIATTSFGAQSVVLLHLLARHAPEIPVVCVDTGYLFPETYVYAEEVQSILGLGVKFYTSPISPARMEATRGRLWQNGPEGIAEYGRLRKVEPLDRALKEHGAAAWISGIRRSQSGDRGKRPFVETQNRTTKIYPILDWTDERIDAYMREHGLPAHPLVERGFVSIGDWHSTRKLEEGMTPEQTRHGGLQRECGLHLESGQGDFQI